MIPLLFGCLKKSMLCELSDRCDPVGKVTERLLDARAGWSVQCEHGYVLTLRDISPA